MPIYAYRCSACGHQKDVLQKMSDTPLSVCPACGESTFTKQVTAAGFQLKGSGWYVTDFRNGNTGGKPAGESKPADAAPTGSTETSKGAESKDSAAAPAPAVAAKDPGSSSAPAPSPAPSAGSGAGSGAGQ